MARNQFVLLVTMFLNDPPVRDSDSEVRWREINSRRKMGIEFSRLLRRWGGEGLLTRTVLFWHFPTHRWGQHLQSIMCFISTPGSG